MLHYTHPHRILHDIVRNSSDALVDYCLCCGVFGFLFGVPAVLEEVYTLGGDLFCRLFVYLSHHAHLLGAYFAVEVDISLI